MSHATCATDSHAELLYGVCGSAVGISHMVFIYPAWPLVNCARLVSKGGALPQTVCLLLCQPGMVYLCNSRALSRGCMSRRIFVQQQMC